MSPAIEIYSGAMRSLGEWVAELEVDERHPRGDMVAGTALLWLCSLDDALRMRVSSYADELARAEGAETLGGLRLARYAVVHGFAVCARSRGLAFPIEYPIDWGPWVWNHAEHYLASWTPWGKATVSVQLAAYGERVERRPLAEPLREAVDWLERWRNEATG